jgi:hypothetical protein
MYRYKQTENLYVIIKLKPLPNAFNLFISSTGFGAHSHMTMCNVFRSHKSCEAKCTYY